MTVLIVASRVLGLMLLWILVLLIGALLWLCIGELLTPHPGVHAQSSTPWFSVTAGNTTCRATKIEQSPPRVSYYCENPTGATAGSYTATAASGAAAPAMVTFGITDNTSTTPGLTCLFGVNTTAAPVTLGALGTIPVSAAAYNCAGATGSLITWP